MSFAIQERQAFYEKAVPISVEAYHFLYKQGLISEKTELLEGVVIEKMPKDPIHANLVTLLASYLYEAIKNEYQLRQENPINTGFSEPEPDIAIVPKGDYASAHPTEALLIIEVANTSIALDRAKASIYAKANIPEYIIVNLQNKILEVYANPFEGKYSLTKILQIDEKFTSSKLTNITFSLSDFISPNS
jgi:Uma2 family endonuclease